MDKRLALEIESRARYDRYFLGLKDKLKLTGEAGKEYPEDCLRECIAKIEKFCHPLSLYALQYLNLLEEHCAKGGSAADIDPKYGCDASI